MTLLDLLDGREQCLAVRVRNTVALNTGTGQSLRVGAVFAGCAGASIGPGAPLLRIGGMVMCTKSGRARIRAAGARHGAAHCAEHQIHRESCAENRSKEGGIKLHRES